MTSKRRSMGLPFAFAHALSIALIINLVWLLASAGQVYACKCAQPGSPTEELEKFSAVFAGTVVSVQHSYDPDAKSVTPNDRTTVRFEVTTVWKGAVHQDMYVTTPPTGGSCGFAFIEGEEYVVYAYDSPYDADGYTVGICSRTALLRQAQADLDALGPGNTPLAGAGGPVPESPSDPAFCGVWEIFWFSVPGYMRWVGPWCAHV